MTDNGSADTQKPRSSRYTPPARSSDKHFELNPIGSMWTMTSYWINKYQPLGLTVGGRAAARKAGESQFVDGSHRRESHLASDIAGISSICRGKFFAPRLKEGDVVLYLTVKGTYSGERLLNFNEQLERIGEVAVVILLGGMLHRDYFTLEAVWFTAVLFLLIRPPLGRRFVGQRAPIS